MLHGLEDRTPRGRRSRGREMRLPEEPLWDVGITKDLFRKRISGPAASSSRNGEEHPGSSMMTTTWRNALTIDSKLGMWPLGGWGGRSLCCGSRQAGNSFFFPYTHQSLLNLVA